MKYLAILFTVSISTLSTHFYLSKSTSETTPENATVDTVTKSVDVDLALRAPQLQTDDQAKMVLNTQLKEAHQAFTAQPEITTLTLQQNTLPIPNTYLQAPQAPEHTNCDCQRCAATVPHPFVRWVDKEVTLCATVYEVEETAEPFCECVEKNGQCETITGVQNVRRLVPRKRKWIQTIKYPEVVYFDRETPLKCGTTVRECPAVPKPPVPGNAGERTPFGGPVNQAPPAGTNVPLRRIEG